MSALIHRPRPHVMPSQPDAQLSHNGRARSLPDRRARPSVPSPCTSDSAGSHAVLSPATESSLTTGASAAETSPRRPGPPRAPDECLRCTCFWSVGWSPSGMRLHWSGGALGHALNPFWRALMQEGLVDASFWPLTSCSAHPCVSQEACCDRSLWLGRELHQRS